MSGFVFSSDWHLSYGTWANHPTLVGDSYHSLRQIVDYCIEKNCPLIAGGDLFDKPVPDPVSVSVMCREMDRMQAEGLPVYFIQGQHERVKRSAMGAAELGGASEWMGVHAWPTHVHKQTFTIEGKKFYGLDWTPPDRIEEELAAIPDGTYFLVCHQVWREFMGDTICQPECNLGMVPVVSEVLTGDFHETRTVHNGAYITMHSPGSISMRSMGEPADKYFYHFLRQLTDPDIPAPHPPQQHPMEAIKLQTRVMAEVTIDTEETLDRFVQYTPEPVSWDTAELPEELSRPLLRVNYHDDIAEVYARIIAAVEQHEPAPHLFLYPQRVREDAVEVDGDLRERIRGQGLLGCLAEVEDENSMVYKTTSRLLQSTDPASELAAIHTEYLEEEAE
jgi:DNA repair exonuclease SbcCD nuclease subunit